MGVLSFATFTLVWEFLLAMISQGQRGLKINAFTLTYDYKIEKKNYSKMFVQ